MKKIHVNFLEPSQQQLNSLLEYYQAGRYVDAEKLSLSITQEFPKHQFAWKVLAVILKQNGKINESLIVSQKSVQLDPQDAEAHNNLGVLLQQQGRLDEAETSYRQAITLKPDYVEAHSNLGGILKELGRLDEAETSYRQAITLKPDYVEAHSNLGGILKELGRLDEAETSYRQAITLKPDYVEAHSNLGIILKEFGRLKESEASYRKAIELKPDLAETHYNLGITLKELGRLDEAETSYRKALELKPDLAEAYSNLGNTLQAQDRLKEAEENYRQAITLKPDYVEAHYNLGVLLQELERLDEAEASYNHAIALKPDFTDALQNRWKILFGQKRYEAALKDADLIISKGTRAFDLTTLYALGQIEEIYKRIETQSKMDGENLDIAAFAAFVAESEKKPTTYNFCPSPMDFMHVSNISSHLGNSTEFLREVIGELDNVKTIWEPHGRTARKGFVTDKKFNLFASTSGKLAQLKAIIFDEIDAYYLKFKEESCSYIKKWPSEIFLYGWHVVLKQQGYNTAHIHPTGWLSGVIYLKVVPDLGKNEGAIEFSLNGENYHHKNSPSFIFQPEVGDIVFFPSSLHHKTIPFTTDTDRIIVSFDLLPEAIKR
ncbi:tetratricopeptide repeat protein [Candidatus Pelagibacter sp.]|nr:tetratricopeptide repeat protein [Candidatus Pelagibacter sp.]